MEQIIEPVDRLLIIKELTPDKFLGKTNRGGNEIYVCTAADAPDVMREIGRLREWAFRSAGGGTGRSADIDGFDTMEKPYRQLIVWNPEDKEIIGGYRFILGKDVVLRADGQPHLATAEMYRFEKKFITDYLPFTVELGRSFVHPDYQSSRAGAKSLFALDNLWDGLGAVIAEYPELKYCFGKITVYPHYKPEARDLIFGFMRQKFPDSDKMITPIEPFRISVTPEQCALMFGSDDYKEDLKILNCKVRELGVNIPPLVNAYLGLSPRMRIFGFAVFHEFGEVIECCIMIPLEQMYEEKKQRHVKNYLQGER